MMINFLRITQLKCIYLRKYFDFAADSIVEDMVWFVGDNFAAKTFQAHCMKNSYKHFTKDNYEYSAFCNSKFASSKTNMLARVQNAFAAALSSDKKGKLPKYVVIVLDEDLITFLDFEHEGVATLLGSWVEWLAKEINESLKQGLKQLPQKCHKEVFFYWVAAPLHTSFGRKENDLRIKFNLSLNSVIRTHKNMRIVKLKDWNPKDTTLVAQNRFTEPGLSAYWNTIDSTFKFNVQRREAFLAKQAGQQQQTSTGDAKHQVEGEDPMLKFFEHRHFNGHERYNGSSSEDTHSRRSYAGNQMGFHEDFDRFHNYNGNSRQRYHADGCFLLPRLHH